MWFDFGRSEGFPTQYAPNETAVTVDVLEAGLITAFIILVVSCLISLPTTRVKTNISLFIRVSYILLTGLFLLLGNFGQEWEVGQIQSKTPYKAGTGEEINASMGIKIGLRSVNVTLKSHPQTGKLQNEIINYNERFSWTWDQGRFGFGPYAGHLQQEFRAAQYRGLPIPILWIVDYFVIDGEGFRFGRFYRTAGWYCHIALWCAFTCWILAVILFKSVLRYGSYCLATCGILQLLANLLWLVIRNPLPLKIPFEDATITTKFGGSYWITLVSGICNIIVSLVVIFMDAYGYDSILYTFFSVDPLNSYDEVAYLTKQEQLQLRKKDVGNDVPLIEMNAGPSDRNELDEYQPIYIKRGQARIVAATAPPVVRSNKPRHLMKK